MATTCDINGKKPEITYPCEWEYKLIIVNGVDINEIVKNTLKEKPYNLSLSNESKTGKYESYNLSLEVKSETQREEFFTSFKKNENIKYVL